MIKLIIAVAITTIFNLNIFSQIKKGTKMPGITVGTVFYNSGKNEISFPPPTTGFTSEVSSAGINLGPSMGWFVSDNTAVGASFLFLSVKTKQMM